MLYNERNVNSYRENIIEGKSEKSKLCRHFVWVRQQQFMLCLNGYSIIAFLRGSLGPKSYRVLALYGTEVSS